MARASQRSRSRRCGGGAAQQQQQRSNSAARQQRSAAQQQRVGALRCVALPCIASEGLAQGMHVPR